uniref:Uncharacterized protein n=1 Tax=Tanacetum cinerariifolium TaxID=118510 RepID=A0A699SPT7_TANCI|nr:hypothetical protein [Tanacetum cinerariifolium]
MVADGKGHHGVGYLVQHDGEQVSGDVQQNGCESQAASGRRSARASIHVHGGLGSLGVGEPLFGARGAFARLKPGADGRLGQDAGQNVGRLAIGNVHADT